MAATRKKYTLEDKRILLEMYNQLPRMNQKDAATKLNMSQYALSALLRNRSRILKSQGTRSAKTVIRWYTSSGLEAALWKWIDSSKQNGICVTYLMIHRKAVELSEGMGIVNFKASPAWYNGFKKREMIVREKYCVYPETTHSQNCCLQQSEMNSGAPSAAETHQVLRVGKTEEICSSINEMVTSGLSEHLPVKRERSVITAQVNGNMQTITVPSLQQMKDAMKTLATGLLYRGFCGFQLLHQFENEVANIVRRAVIQGCKDSFVT